MIAGFFFPLGAGCIVTAQFMNAADSIVSWSQGWVVVAGNDVRALHGGAAPGRCGEDGFVSLGRVVTARGVIGTVGTNAFDRASAGGILAHQLSKNFAIVGVFIGQHLSHYLIRKRIKG